MQFTPQTRVYNRDGVLVGTILITSDGFIFAPRVTSNRPPLRSMGYAKLMNAIKRRYGAVTIECAVEG